MGSGCGLEERGLAPLPALGLDGTEGEVELLVGHVLHAERVHEVCTVKSQSTISASGFRQILHEQRDPSPYSDLPSISAVSMR